MITPLRTQRDLRYEAHRNALIPAAVEHTNFAIGKAPSPQERHAYECWSAAWDREFLSQMERLAKEAQI